ncbi:MAG: hypothetical protein ACQEQV_03025 [Fibrobacterota bacterium]
MTSDFEDSVRARKSEFRLTRFGFGMHPERLLAVIISGPLTESSFWNDVTGVCRNYFEADFVILAEKGRPHSKDAPVEEDNVYVLEGLDDETAEYLVSRAHLLLDPSGKFHDAAAEKTFVPDCFTTEIGAAVSQYLQGLGCYRNGTEAVSFARDNTTVRISRTDSCSKEI